MKTLFLVAGLVFVTCISLFSATEQEIIAKLREIDEAMMQGAINYKTTVFRKNGDKRIQTRSLIYDSEGRYKKVREAIVPNNKTKIYATDYLDDKHYFVTFTSDQSIVIADRAMLEELSVELIFISYEFSNSPSLQYGRGLTLLKDLKIDSAKNIATAQMLDGSIVEAYLDPNLDYAAYKSERGLGNSGFPTKAEMNNSNPILADGKYYIFSKSILYSVSFENSPAKEYTMELISATFKTPDEKDYIFDWNKNTFENIVDARGTKKQDVLVEYKKSELPEGITLDELLKITKEELL